MTASIVHAGLEAGGTKMVVGIADEGNRLLARESLPTTTPEETLPALRAAILRLADGARIASLGIGTFGPAQTRADAERFGHITSTPKPGWSDTDLLGALSDLAPACGFDTDVNGAALAEAAAWGGADPLAYVTVGTGIGVGVARSDGVLAGTAHFEVGHVPVPRAPGDEGACQCPFHEDCLEGLAAGPSWTARLGVPLSAVAADHPARAHAVHYLGQLCRTLTLTHAPGRIVMGGGVMRTQGLLGATQAAAERLLGGYGPPLPEIVAPMLEDDAGLLGAIMLGRRAAEVVAAPRSAPGSSG